MGEGLKVIAIYRELTIELVLLQVNVILFNPN
jgi:hypothetical protein